MWGLRLPDDLEVADVLTRYHEIACTAAVLEENILEEKLAVFHVGDTAFDSLVIWLVEQDRHAEASKIRRHGCGQWSLGRPPGQCAQVVHAQKKILQYLCCSPVPKDNVCGVVSQYLGCASCGGPMERRVSLP